MKYIIEFEDEPCMRENGVNYYTCKSAPWYNLGETIINRLTPFAEPDRKAIEDEVWSLAKEIAYCMSFQECIDTGMLHDDDIYNSASGVLEKLTYQEAKAKYEAWLKQKDEIRVGDEVIIKSDGVKGVVLDEDLYGEFYVFTENECCEAYRKIHFEKTGRHLDGVEKLLEEMRGNS